jgi:hypothetical protein
VPQQDTLPRLPPSEWRKSPKNFSSLADARADAKNIIKGIYTQGDSKIHLAADERLDWQAAMDVLRS